ALYLAVVVTDHSWVADTSAQANWNTQDGAELYLDLAHQATRSLATQYSQYGTERLTFGQQGNWDIIDMVMVMTDSGRIYEWQVNLDQEIYSGLSLGFDLSVADKDPDDTFSWNAWGKNAQKLSSPERCGDLVLLEEGSDLATIAGKLDLSGLPIKSLAASVRFKSVDHPKMWVQTVSDSLGNYSLTVPVGSYILGLPAKLIFVEEDYYRIAPGDPVAFTVASNPSDQPPVLAPQLVPGPDLQPEEGLLHIFGEKEKKTLDDFIATYQEYYSIPGVSLALIKEGEIIFHQTYGVKNTVTEEPVDEQTLFEAASITKPVFAFVVLRLAEKGMIDLDKPLADYLAFEALEKYPEYKQMTARHVLIHRTGLPNWGTQLEHTPGTTFGYSGEGFEYLKRVVAHIMDEDIEQVIDDELINPLDLYHMEFSDNEDLRKVVSKGHLGSHPTNWPIPQQPGMAYSLHTEAKAFAKFAVALLERKGLQPQTYEEFMSIKTESEKEYWRDEKYREGPGLGIFIRETDHGNTFFHGGNNGDFKCLFEVYPDLNMGYVVFTNSNMGDVLADDLADLLVEGKKVEGE
ncbi:MAG: serine hydrolase domain-containing protein, partial [Cyclobacteriaceae bacterium]